MAIIEVTGLSKDFTYYEKATGLKGSVKNLFHREKKIRHAVNNISFSIEEGEMVGFIGPNGAGKTTTLKMLSGILYPTAGDISVNGYIPSQRRDEFKRSFALVAGQKSQLWFDLPAMESFYLNKCIYGISDDAYRKTVDELAEMLNVQDFLQVQVRRLSLGERMKMELIAAVLHHPKILFLDEPTIGLDILSQNAIRGYLKDYNKKTGSTTILTSHYTKDIEDVCRRTIIINKGEKVFDGGMSDLQKHIGGRKNVTFTFPEKADSDELSRFGKVTVEDNTATFEVSEGELDRLVRLLLEAHTVVDMSIAEISIETCIEAIYRAE